MDTIPLTLVFFCKIIIKKLVYLIKKSIFGFIFLRIILFSGNKFDNLKSIIDVLLH